MNRRGFLKICLGGVAAVVTAPLVLASKEQRPTEAEMREHMDAVRNELYGYSPLMEALNDIRSHYPVIVIGKDVFWREDVRERSGRLECTRTRL
jgi:hypothetical protein